MSKQSFQVRDSRQRGHFWADNRIVKRDGKMLGVYGISIYCLLCIYADNNDQSAYPSIPTLAATLGCSERKAQTTLKELERAGWIRKELRKDPKNPKLNKTNMYYLLNAPEEQIAQDAPPPGAQDAPPPGAQDAPELTLSSELHSKDSAPAGAEPGTHPSDSGQPAKFSAGDIVKSEDFQGIITSSVRGSNGITWQYVINAGMGRLMAFAEHDLTLVKKHTPPRTPQRKGRRFVPKPLHDAGELPASTVALTSPLYKCDDPVLYTEPAPQPAPEPKPKQERKPRKKSAAKNPAKPPKPEYWNDILVEVRDAFDVPIGTATQIAEQLVGVAHEVGKKNKRAHHNCHPPAQLGQAAEYAEWYKAGHQGIDIASSAEALEMWWHRFITGYNPDNDTNAAVKYIDGWTSETIDQAVHRVTQSAIHDGPQSDAAAKFNEIMGGQSE